MYFQIQEILITTTSTLQNLFSGVGGSIIGAIITGFVTYIITKNTNNENKKQWKYELFNKKKSEYILQVILQSANLNTISFELTKLSNNTFKALDDFHIKNYQELFNTLSKLSVFLSKKNELYKFISKILNNLELYLNLILDIKDIIDNKQDAYKELIKHSIVNNIDDGIVFTIGNYIEYILKQHNGVWLCDGKKYALFEEFEILHQNKFDILMRNIHDDLLKLHDNLIDKYIVI